MSDKCVVIKSNYESHTCICWTWYKVSLTKSHISFCYKYVLWQQHHRLGSMPRSATLRHLQACTKYSNVDISSCFKILRKHHSFCSAHSNPRPTAWTMMMCTVFWATIGLPSNPYLCYFVWHQDLFSSWHKVWILICNCLVHVDSEKIFFFRPQKFGGTDQLSLLHKHSKFMKMSIQHWQNRLQNRLWMKQTERSPNQ